MAIGSIGQRVMVRLVNKLGGVEKASQALGIPSTILLRFIEGRANVPDVVLLRAVDHVLDEMGGTQLPLHPPATEPLTPSAPDPQKPPN